MQNKIKDQKRLNDYRDFINYKINFKSFLEANFLPYFKNYKDQNLSIEIKRDLILFFDATYDLYERHNNLDIIIDYQSAFLENDNAFKKRQLFLIDLNLRKLIAKLSK